MVESLSELRKKVQEPVRPFNDLSGMLVGDWLSLPISRAFLVLGLSPTVATVGMLLFGLAGSALLLFGDGAAVFGFACVFCYYILDCVDGEVARYRSCEKVHWSLHEFFFHLYVKSVFFICLGLMAVETTGRPWVFAFAVSALLGTFFRMFQRDVALQVICRSALLRGASDCDHVARQLGLDAAAAAPPPAPDPDAPVPYPFFGGPLAKLRIAIVNFDLSQLYFLTTAILDLFLPRLEAFGIPFDLKTLLFVFYGIVLPLHFADTLCSYLRNGDFRNEARELLGRAHHFRLKR